MVRADDPVAEVPEIHELVQVDGSLNENAWKHAVHLSLSDFWSQSNAPETGEALVFCTPYSLCVGFVLQDADIRSEQRPRDGKTYNDDCAEVFLGKPIANLEDSLGFEINAAGSVCDFRYHHPQHFDYAWTATGIKTAIARYPDLPGDVTKQTGPGWVVEMEIPWDWLCQELALSQRPSTLRANFARWNHGAQGRVFTIWSNSYQTPPQPHQPGHYGWLKFQSSAFQDNTGTVTADRRSKNL